jgi:hypothetical protein
MERCSRKPGKVWGAVVVAVVLGQGVTEKWAGRLD